MKQLKAYSVWIADAGVSRTTGWRWRRDGFIETMVIAGRVYVSEEAIERFIGRAAAGELAGDNRRKVMRTHGGENDH